ncbi:MAG: hypothetical protein RL660_1426 [Bacteroidota bacterium]|jgi:hypothetical protein
MNGVIDGNLIVSETNLAIVCDSEFDAHIWYIGEPFIDYAVDIITDTIYNLYKRKVIDIDVQTKEYKIYGFEIWSETKYLAKLDTNKYDLALVGWFEERIINSISDYEWEELDKLISNVLNQLFGKNYECTNPGKEFIQLGLENQKFKFFTFERSFKFFSSKIKVWQDAEQVNKLGRVKIENWDNERNACDDFDLRRIVKKQLVKFTGNGG